MIHRSLVYGIEYKRFVFLRHLKIIFLSFMLVVISLFNIESIVNSSSTITYKDDRFSYTVDTDSKEAIVESYIKRNNDGYVQFDEYVNDDYKLAKVKSGIFSENNYSWFVTYIRIYGTPELEQGCFDGLTNFWYFDGPNYTSFDLSLLKDHDSFRSVGLANITSFTRDPENRTKIPASSLNYVSNYKLTGETLHPVIKLGKAELTEGIDYDLDSTIKADSIKKVYVKAIMKGNFKGEIVMEINIVSSVLNDSNTDIIIQNIEKIYDGTSWRLDDLGNITVNITYDGSGVSLVPNNNPSQDGYKLVLPENKDAGTYDLTFEFNGQYAGNIIKKKLTITPKDLEESDVQVNFNENKEYGSKWGVDDIEKVMFGDKELVEGQDYTVVFNDDLDIDSQNAIFTFKGNYSGTVTKALPTKPRDLSNENVIVNANPSTKEYDGYEWSPSFSIIFNGKEIPSDSYSIELPNNRVDAGIKRVKITFKGNYTGTITRDFEITQNQLPKIDIIPDSEWKEYDGNVWNPSFRVAINGEELGEENGDFYIEYPDDMVNAGDKEIKFVFSKKFKGEVTKTLEIEQKDFNSLTIETEDRHIYDGNVWSPSIVVKDGENVLKENEDYTVTLSTNMISEGEKLLILDFKNYSGNYMKKLKIESWGTPKTMHSPDGNRITNYVRSNGETSVEITDFGKVWLHEESNGSGTWYCLDNSKGIFEKGSKLTIKWLTFGDNEHSNKLKDVDDQTALTNNMKLFDISVTSPDGKKYTYLNDTVDLYIELGGNWNRNNISGLFVGAGEDEIIPTKFITLNTLDGEKEFARMSLKHFSTYLVFDNPATSESKSSSGISENKDSDKSKDTKLAEVRNLSDEIQTEPQSEQESNLENPESVSSEFKESEPVKSTESENILDSSLSHKTENSYNETESSSNTQVSQDHVGEEHGINDNVDDQQIFYDNDRIENNATPNENEIESNKVEDNIVPDEAENESENKELDDIPRYQNPSTNYDVSLGRAQDNHSTIALLFSFLCIASLARRFNLRIH